MSTTLNAHDRSTIDWLGELSGLGPQHDVVQHMRVLPHRDVAAAIRTAWASTVPPAVRLAFEFLVLTAVRWGEVRWAEWTEIDRDEGVWIVPARRTKISREHRVPLSGRALEILDGAPKLVEGTSPFLFPDRVGKQLEEKQLRRMFQKHKIAAVPHGCRSSFRDWAAEETDYPREVFEVALAHVIQNRVEAAYRRTDLFERRRRLMDDVPSRRALRTGGRATPPMTHRSLDRRSAPASADTAYPSGAQETRPALSSQLASAAQDSRPGVAKASCDLAKLVRSSLG